MKNKRVVVMLVLLVLLLFVNLFILISSGPDIDDILPPGRDEEPILAFETELRVSEDDSVYVTEQVKAKSLAKNLKRGLTRRLPLSFTNSKNESQGVDYELISVMRNGESIAVAEPQRERTSVIYYLGEADKFLIPGEYQFLFQYIMRGRIEKLEKMKRLYFDVTGTPLFPIYQASATVRIPYKLKQENFNISGAIVKPTESEENPESKSKEHVAISFALDDGQTDPASRDKPIIRIWTTRRLEPLERFEIAVSWATE